MVERPRRAVVAGAKRHRLASVNVVQGAQEAGRIHVRLLQGGGHGQDVHEEKRPEAAH